jgi:hypothetical protein
VTPNGDIRAAYAENVVEAEAVADSHREVTHAALDLLHVADLEELDTYETLPSRGRIGDSCLRGVLGGAECANQQPTLADGDDKDDHAQDDRGIVNRVATYIERRDAVLLCLIGAWSNAVGPPWRWRWLHVIPSSPSPAWRLSTARECLGLLWRTGTSAGGESHHRA